MEEKTQEVAVVEEKKVNKGVVKKILIGLGGIVGLAVAGVMIHKHGQESVACPMADHVPNYLDYSNGNQSEEM